MKAPEEKPRKRHPDRGLHFRRTRYRPGLGICRCGPCRSWFSLGIYGLGDPNPSGGCQYLDCQAVFAEEWEYECEPRSWRNFGMGLLQDLMFVRSPTDHSAARSRLAFRLTRRERVVAATVIQWLGSNCGREFIARCLGRCGYRIVRIEEEDRPHA